MFKQVPQSDKRLANLIKPQKQSEMSYNELNDNLKPQEQQHFDDSDERAGKETNPSGSVEAGDELKQVEGQLRRSNSDSDLQQNVSPNSEILSEKYDDGQVENNTDMDIEESSKRYRRGIGNRIDYLHPSQVQTQDLKFIHYQYANNIQTAFRQRIESLKQKCQQVAENVDENNNPGVTDQILSQIETQKNKLYQDICLAQTLHPEMTSVLRHYSDDLFQIDSNLSKKCLLVGCTSTPKESTSYFSRYCAIQALKRLVSDCKHVTKTKQTASAPRGWRRFLPRCRIALCEKKYYEVDLELTDHLRETIRKEPNQAYTQLMHLSNLLTEALTTSEGIGELVLTQSGEYIGIEFESEVQSKKIYYQLRHVLTDEDDFTTPGQAFHFSEEMLEKRHQMVGMEKALDNEDVDDEREVNRSKDDKKLLLRSMDRFIIKDDD